MLFKGRDRAAVLEGSAHVQGERLRRLVSCSGPAEGESVGICNSGNEGEPVTGRPGRRCLSTLRRRTEGRLPSLQNELEGHGHVSKTRQRMIESLLYRER